VAANLISSQGIPESTAADAAEVAKAPFKYIGQAYQFDGVIGLVQEYPENSSFGRSVGYSGVISEVVATDSPLATSTPLDFLILGDVGSLREGDPVTVTGYVTGLVNVTNRLGGKTTQLVIVGALSSNRIASATDTNPSVAAPRTQERPALGPFTCDDSKQIRTMALENCQDSADVIEVQIQQFTGGADGSHVDLMANNTADGSDASAGSIVFIGDKARVTIPAKGPDGVSNGSFAGMQFDITRNSDGRFAVTRTK
jgi:hypothetical protein